MRRRPTASQDCIRPAKKQRVSSADYFDDPSKEVKWLDIERVIAGADEEDVEPGWIAGTVFMVFGSKNKSEAQLKSGTMLLKITISCLEYQMFKFTIRQSLRLSLRGAHIIKLKGGTSAPGHLPFSLSFTDGAAVKVMNVGKSVEDGMIIDSWQEKSSIEDEQQEEDWYIGSPVQEASPPIRDTEPAASSSSQSSPFPETPGRNMQTASYESSITISNGVEQDTELAVDVDVRDVARHMTISNDKVPVHETDSEAGSTPSLVSNTRKMKKRETRHDRLRMVKGESSTELHEAVSGEPPKLSRAEKKRRKRELHLAKEASPKPPERNPALDLPAGVSTEAGAYPSLESVLENTFVHVIGVVGSVDVPSQTRRGDFSLTVTLVDPSKFKDGAGFKVTCFMKSGFEQILPSSQKGHVLLLRNVRTTKWRSNINGTVYPDRLKWVGYDPHTGKTYYPEPVAQQSSPGNIYDAYHRPGQSEVSYLAQLGEWWKAVKEEEECGAIQIPDYSRNRREHRLIGICKVGEFFNATVEMLRVEEAESGQTTLIFTDYTPHPQRSTEGYYGQYGMHASTAKIESEFLDVIKPGTYWSIKNMRLKIGQLGTLEADLYRVDLYELDVDEDDMHLRELLKRKEAYLNEHPQNPGQGDVVDTVISEISQAGHYNIVAELLYRTRPRDSVTDLFVTDYTDNPSLSTYKPEGLKRQLNGSPLTVLQISAWDGHDFIRDMDVGRIYSFTDVRIKEFQDTGLKGNLKFADKRITRMNMKIIDNVAVSELVRKKNQYAASASIVPEDKGSSSQSSGKHKPPVVISDAIKSRHADQRLNTIAQIKSVRKCPNKFRVITRIVDFYPLDISDFTVRICTNCNERIPDQYNACIDCSDFMNEHVKWFFHFRFLLEDEKGETLEVDASDEARYFLRGLKPCDLKEDDNALWAIKRRLRGCLGNLVEVHEGLKRNERIEPECAPYFDLAVKCCEVSNGSEMEKTYALTGCEAIEPAE